VNILLIAAGSGTRWGNYLGVPKHVAPIRGTTVLGRLVEQFGPHGDVTVVGPDDDRYRIAGSRLVTPTIRGTDADKFLSSRHLWDGRTLVVYGDIFLTHPAVARIVSAEDMLTAFGRWSKSRLTGTPYGELFAYNFPAAAQAEVEAALWDIDGWEQSGQTDRSGGWELYQRLNGATVATVRKHKQLPGPCRFVDIDDWSDDFDWPEDYERWKKARTAAGMPV
jgi:hypothetical protein